MTASYGPMDAYRPPVASDGLPVVPTPSQIRVARDGTSQTPRRSRLRMVRSVVGVLLITACGVTIMLIIGSETGRTGFVLGALLATLPVPVLIAALRWLDRYEPEPTRLLVLAFVWGAAVATLAAITLNTVGSQAFFSGPADTIDPQAAVYLAPPVEEFAKGSLLLILAFRRRLDGVLDGIVFAGVIGVGFAFTENILYYGRVYAETSDTGNGLLSSLVLFVVRGIVSPFAHPLFTLPIGIALGLAVRYRNPAAWIVVPIVGYGLAMTLHGTWNGLAVRAVEQNDPGLMLFGYAAIMVPTFAAAIALAVWVRRREGRVLRRRLPPFAESSWIAPHEVAVLSSLRLRQLGLDLARQVAGKDLRRATRTYQHHVIGLGFLRERLASGHHIEQGLAQQHQMLAALPALRARALLLPPPPPPRIGLQFQGSQLLGSHSARPGGPPPASPAAPLWPTPTGAARPGGPQTWGQPTPRAPARWGPPSGRPPYGPPYGPPGQWGPPPGPPPYGATHPWTLPQSAPPPGAPYVAPSPWGRPPSAPPPGAPFAAPGQSVRPQPSPQQAPPPYGSPAQSVPPQPGPPPRPGGTGQDGPARS